MLKNGDCTNTMLFPPVQSLLYSVVKRQGSCSGMQTHAALGTPSLWEKEWLFSHRPRKGGTGAAMFP